MVNIAVVARMFCLKVRTLYHIYKEHFVFNLENIGANMSIDDKAAGHAGFTVLSNSDTEKIAMLVESTSA